VRAELPGVCSKPLQFHNHDILKPLGIWALDPIDGTKGFLRGGQYAVCLALMVDGMVAVGAMGCPNLPIDPANPDGMQGLLFSAVKGAGASVVSSSYICWSLAF
jgi:3'-phosphoadenosine 5'-phosphosulfate (PAPS) 3'-phosphatase